MPGTDLLEQSATRAELDQRSRDARLRLETVERLLVVRLLPTPSLLRRVLRCLGSKIYAGRYIGSRSTREALSARRMPERRRMRSTSGGAAGGSPAAPPLTWPSCQNRTRLRAAR
jgi:hypothetical protein